MTSLFTAYCVVYSMRVHIEENIICQLPDGIEFHVSENNMNKYFFLQQVRNEKSYQQVLTYV